MTPAASRLRTVALAVVGSIAIAGSAVAEPPPASPTPRPGDAGTARTVLSGDAIEELPVRFIGALDGALGPGIDLYLVELLGEVGETVGVANGMSGSPVYFEGRLFGALSYRMGAFPERAIAGVTRIEDMRAADLAMLPSSPPAVADAELDAPGAAGGLRPIATPVAYSGLTPRVREWLDRELAPYGWVLAPGGASSTGDAASADPGAEGAADGPAPVLLPGSAVGVELVRGAISLAATGTVTSVDGDVVLAFGHPFFGSGNVRAPLVAASVVHTLSDRAGSQKLSNVGREVGATVGDRTTAIVGRLGARAPMVPLRVEVVDPRTGSETYRFEVISGAPMSPSMFGASIASALSDRLGFETDVTAFATGSVRLADYPDVPIDLAFSSDRGGHPVFRVAQGVQQVLGTLASNRFRDVYPTAVDLRVELRPGAQSYRLVELLYPRDGVEPGETLEVTVVMERRRGETLERTLSLRVPEGTEAGTRLALAVGSPRDVESVSGEPIGSRRSTATGIEELVATFANPRGEHRLTAMLFRRDPAVVAGGAVFGQLPPTIRSLVKGARPSREQRALGFVPVATAETSLDGPVYGGLAGGMRVR